MRHLRQRGCLLLVLTALSAAPSNSFVSSRRRSYRNSAKAAAERVRGGSLPPPPPPPPADHSHHIPPPPPPAVDEPDWQQQQAVYAAQLQPQQQAEAYQQQQLPPEYEQQPQQQQQQQLYHHQQQYYQQQQPPYQQQLPPAQQHEHVKHVSPHMQPIQQQQPQQRPYIQPYQQQQQQQPPSAFKPIAGSSSSSATVDSSGNVITTAVQPPIALLNSEISIMERLKTQHMDNQVISEGLNKLYRKKVVPLEKASEFPHFHSPSLTDADFDAKPLVLVIGQYSVGKTSFISSLLQTEFAGQRVGPEPTTDRFTAVVYGTDKKNIPGHALAMQKDSPFRSLEQFGNSFLQHFDGSTVDAPILRDITIVDTPGVLSGEKQRIGRDYDFPKVASWFAERAGMIIIMFDAHKLDISDELSAVITALKPHIDKVRIVLNKADTMDSQQLMRVYGSLMWSLSRVIQVYYAAMYTYRWLVDTV
jgi:GTPase SAR1 family protein